VGGRCRRDRLRGKVFQCRRPQCSAARHPGSGSALVLPGRTMRPAVRRHRPQPGGAIRADPASDAAGRTDDHALAAPQRKRPTALRSNSYSGRTARRRSRGPGRAGYDLAHRLDACLRNATGEWTPFGRLRLTGPHDAASPDPVVRFAPVEATPVGLQQYELITRLRGQSYAGARAGFSGGAAVAP